MNLAVLEQELQKKQDAAQALLTKSSAAAETEKRELTDVERQELTAALDAVKAVKAKIDVAKGDQAMRDQIEQMVGSAKKTTPADPSSRKQTAQTLGQQFVGSEAFQAWNAATRGRKSSKGVQWSSPVIPLHPFGETLTTEGGSPGSGGDLIVPQYLPGVKVPLLFRRLTIADLLASGSTDSNAIIYMRETLFTNAADTVAEGAVKPESTLRFDQETDPVHTIAHWLPVTEQMLEDVPAIRAYIDARLILGVQLAEEDKLLNGAASPAEVIGLRNRTGLRADEAGGSGAQANAEAIFRQIYGIFNDALVMPTGIVMNPTNWQTLQLMKDTTNQYMGSGPWAPPQSRTLWGLPVVVTPVMDLGVALVGDFSGSAQVFRKGGIDVQATNSHSDYFIRNLVAIRAEERLALAVYRPAAFGEVTGLD